MSANKKTIRDAIAGAMRNTVRYSENKLLKALAKEFSCEASEIKIEINKGRDEGWLEYENDGMLRLTSQADELLAPAIIKFIKKNWAHILSNAIALIALAVSFIALRY